MAKIKINELNDDFGDHLKSLGYSDRSKTMNRGIKRFTKSSDDYFDVHPHGEWIHYIKGLPKGTNHGIDTIKTYTNAKITSPTKPTNQRYNISAGWPSRGFNGGSN